MKALEPADEHEAGQQIAAEDAKRIGIQVPLLLCKVNPQIWTGWFLIFVRKLKKPEYSYSIARV